MSDDKLPDTNSLNTEPRIMKIAEGFAQAASANLIAEVTFAAKPGGRVAVNPPSIPEKAPAVASRKKSKE